MSTSGRREKTELKEALLKVLKKRSPELVSRLYRGWLHPGDALAICDHLTKELILHGLDKNDEPNEFGRLLGELTEIFSSLEIKYEGELEIPVPPFIPHIIRKGR